MNFNATITVREPTDVIRLKKLFATEDSVLSNERASYEIVEKKDEVEFVVQAQDAVALRAMTSAITKTLAVFYKVKKIL